MEDERRTTVRVGEGGRIVIPAEIREALGMQVGAELVLTVREDHATLMNARTARRRGRARVRKYLPAGARPSEELRAEREREARRE